MGVGQLLGAEACHNAGSTKDVANASINCHVICLLWAATRKCKLLPCTRDSPASSDCSSCRPAAQLGLFSTHDSKLRRTHGVAIGAGRYTERLLYDAEEQSLAVLLALRTLVSDQIKQRIAAYAAMLVLPQALELLQVCFGTIGWKPAVVRSDLTG